MVLAVVAALVVGCASAEPAKAAPVKPAPAAAAPVVAVDADPWTMNFDDGTAMGWAGNNSDAMVSKEKAKSGEYSLKVMSGDAGWKTAWNYKIGDKILGNVPYSYSAWIYHEKGSDVKFNITIKTSFSAYKGAVQGATVPSGVWTEIKSDSFTLSSADGQPGDIYIEPATPGVVFYIDDIAILPK